MGDFIRQFQEAARLANILGGILEHSDQLLQTLNRFQPQPPQQGESMNLTLEQESQLLEAMEVTRDSMDAIFKGYDEFANRAGPILEAGARIRNRAPQITESVNRLRKATSQGHSAEKSTNGDDNQSPELATRNQNTPRRSARIPLLQSRSENPSGETPSGQSPSGASQITPTTKNRGRPAGSRSGKKRKSS